MTIKEFEFKETEQRVEATNLNIFRQRLANVLEQTSRTKIERELPVMQAWLRGTRNPRRLYPIYKLLQLTHVDLYWLFGLEQKIDNIEPIESSRILIKAVTDKGYRKIFARAFNVWKKQVYAEPQFKQLIAKRLREYINESNYLVLAKILRVSPRTITDYWLKGRSLPTIDKLFKIAEYFNVTIYTFLPVSGIIVYRLEQDNHQFGKTETNRKERKLEESTRKQIGINKPINQMKTIKESKTDKIGRTNIDTAKVDMLNVNVEQDIHYSLTKEDLDAIARQIAKYYGSVKNEKTASKGKNMLRRFGSWLKRMFGKEE